MALLREMGRQTPCAWHTISTPALYDLCDEYGLIVWAEIPYITKHMENGARTPSTR